MQRSDHIKEVGCFLDLGIRIYLEFRASDLEFTKKPGSAGFFFVAPPIPPKNGGITQAARLRRTGGTDEYQPKI